MQLRIALTLFALMIASPENSWAEKIYRVVIFGDSITAGYQLQPQDAFPARLESKLRAAGYENVEVINMSKPNASTASATAESSAVGAKLPDVIILELGFNDSKRGVLASAIASNLNTIIADFKHTGAYIIFMGIDPPSGANLDYAEEVSAYYHSITGATSIAFLPSALEGVKDNAALTLADGMHPNSAGVDVLVEKILPYVDNGLRWRYEVYLHELEQADKAKRSGAVPILQ